MKECMFFDANCRIGNSMNAPGPDAKELLSDMDAYGVDKSLVRHAAIPTGALSSNRSLAEMLRADETGRLTGVWCILPDQCGEIPSPDRFFAEMKENRIGALTLSPFEHRYVPCRWTLGKILDAAAERRVPVLLDAFAGKWPELYSFLKEFPENIFLYLEAWGKWGTDRQIRPLLENFPRFYFGTTGYWIPEGLRDLAEIYGADRILYASGFPAFNQGNQMLQLKQSGLDEKSIAKIAGLNLEKLLKGAQL
ncbi:MAG: Amidohydrolase [Lentisphaerae bacterium ADurb.Bin242]|nr:MAG: Amidohydrolase [Lentisphaerae bacterium ADurb.Bin242]